jgi:rubrerythrin
MQYDISEIARRHHANPRKIEFILNYMSPDSETFGKDKESYLKAFGEWSSPKAPKDMLRRATNIIKDICELAGVSVDKRILALSKILRGEFKQETVTSRVYKDGKERVTHRVVRTPTAREIISLSDHLSKLDGTYTKEQIRKELMSDEVRALAKSFKPDV